MRKSTKIKLDDREYTLLEVRPIDVLSLLPGDGDLAEGEEQVGGESWRELFQKALPLVCEGLDFDGLVQLAPSEIEELWKAFKEVNASFFKIAGWLGMETMVDKAVAAIRQGLAGEFSKAFADLSLQGTEKPPGITDGAASS
jgi:hypothetical protein